MEKILCSREGAASEAGALRCRAFGCVLWRSVGVLAAGMTPSLMMSLNLLGRCSVVR